MARQFRNPILSGFHPDPSICRLGDDYYLATSTFEYFPGVPIFHSRDLVHWRQIGHALDRPSQLPLADARPSGGIYAPALRFHEGIFYLVTTNVSHGGNFVVTARDPAGPWSDPVWIKGATGIDPTLFFDNGRCYYVGNGEPEQFLYDGHRLIWLQEIDLKSMQLVGERRVLVDGGTDISKQPIWIEGPHLYKVGGRYYLLAAEGGTGEDHSVVIFRSENIGGPYESFAGNPIVTNRNLDPNRPFPITSTGHGDLIETQAGEWWMVLLGCRPYAPFAENCYNTGRETFLIPIVWQDGWPVTADGAGHVGYAYGAPNLQKHLWPDGYGLGSFSYKDEFDRPALSGAWNTIRAPADGWLSLTERSGFLRLSLRPEQLAGPGTPSFIGVRQRHADFSVETELEFAPSRENESAGLAVQQNNMAYYSLERAVAGGAQVVRLVKRDPKAADPQMRAQARVAGGRLRLKIQANGANYSFFYAEGGGEWTVLAGGEDGRILSTRHCGGFVGAYIGLYATSHGRPSANHADFDSFYYLGEDESFHSTT